MKEETVSTDSREVIEWRRKQEEIRQKKEVLHEALHEANMRTLKQQLQAGEITQMDYQVEELRSLIEPS
jgi:hypothetical protein